MTSTLTTRDVMSFVVSNVLRLCKRCPYTIPREGRREGDPKAKLVCPLNSFDRDPLNWSRRYARLACLFNWLFQVFTRVYFQAAALVLKDRGVFRVAFARSLESSLFWSFRDFRSFGIRGEARNSSTFSIMMLGMK